MMSCPARSLGGGAVTEPYPWRGEGAWTRLRILEQNVDESIISGKGGAREARGVDRW